MNIPCFPFLLSAATIVLLSGCAATQASNPQPDLKLSSAFTHADTIQKEAETLQWWRQFNDPTLSDLIEKALRSNHDVRMAMTRIKAARAGNDAYASRLWPTIDLRTSASTAQSGVPAPYKLGLPDIRAYQAGIGLAWEIDLGGGLRSAADAAQADLLATEYAAEGVRLLIAGEMARHYFILRGAEQRLRYLKDLADNRQQRANVIARRLEEGQSSRIDLDFARAEANALEAQIPSVQTLVDVTQSQIALLLGENPSSSPVAPNPGYIWPQAPLMGPGQPSDLLRRRPDLMASEARYGAESLRLAEARSQTWPKLFVNALFGYQDLRINGIDLAPVAFSNVAMAFAMPIFNAGRIRSGIEIQNAREEEALLSWQKGVLVAVKEVEDTLSMRTNERKRGESLKRRAAQHRQALDRTESLYREGETDKLALLDVESSLVLSRLDVSEHETQRLLADVQLYKALGGGWNPSDLASKDHTKELR